MPRDLLELAEGAVEQPQSIARTIPYRHAPFAYRHLDRSPEPE
jgi:hypothetical protein